MAHYAKINANNIVEQVIVAEQEFIDSGAVGNPSQWIKTSYNTQGGRHLLGGTPLRKNYAGIGMIYDQVRDAFYHPKPEDGTTWVFDEDTCYWVRPLPEPLPVTGKFWIWDEPTQNWIQVDTIY